jgi:hypothetical protein
MTSLVHPENEVGVMVAGNKSAVLFMDLIRTIGLENNRSGILEKFIPYLEFIDIPMYMGFCSDEEAVDALIELGGECCTILKSGGIRYHDELIEV